MAREFANRFDSGDWAALAGSWHDLGKVADQFQAKLRGEKNAFAHSPVGAAYAARFGELGLLLAEVIGGHHGGLRDFVSFSQDLQPLLRTPDSLITFAKRTGLLVERPALPPLPSFVRPNDGCSVEFWTRMLFSTLVDADYLNTERFFEPAKAEAREAKAALGEMKTRLDKHLLDKTGNAPATPMNSLRARVLTDCRQAAAREPGIFSLTVPTGGGKTLSSMAFALDHALNHGLDRVIVVIPYTSIIEQNAKVYRDVFGDDAVVEHHSALDVEQFADDEKTGWHHSVLAAENWDAPLIVTTSVQFFESLFARRPGRCRKLHNIARSVIILDEVQTLPAKLLAPIVDALGTLAHAYGASIVLSTATQPALRARTTFPQGLTEVREIVANPPALFTATSARTHVNWPADPNQPIAWDALADRLAAESSALCVVHRRDDAQILTRLLDVRLGHEETIHLSATVCAEHRLKIIKEIRRTLEEKKPVRVVSTQLVEAGVDLDFPVVYRALGGLDSVAQAAGRCNREGKLDLGRVEVFVAESQPPMGVPRKALSVTRGLLAGRGPLDIHDPTIYDTFFQRLYALTDPDDLNIQNHRANLRFEKVADKFHMIEDEWNEGIIVPYGKAAEIIADIERRIQIGIPISLRHELRRLQRFTVQIPKKVSDEWRKRGHLLPLGDEIAWRLSPDFFEHAYHLRFGLLIHEGDSWMPSLIV